ncbi:phasin family protein [Pseudaestuariivita rosea]|uniref:phasin family protein n=1 Tax=Pseudaestuariivita rosea TaxID=2763263 RepID=UPI001ABB4953|nr:phasin family protein [Pseudaestuariivita rosea]
MPKTSKDQNDAAPSAASMMDAMADLQKVGFGSLTWMGTAWLENLGDVGSELLSFVAERVQEDVKTQHALLHCKNVEEMRHIQAQFIQKAIDQYTAETGKLVEMGNEMLADARKKASG